MFIRKMHGPRTATLADGSILTMADLPPPDTRWVASRKAVVVQAVAHNLLGRAEALLRYGISEEEFASWEAAVARHGKAALRITALQQYRQPQVAKSQDMDRVTRY